MRLLWIVPLLLALTACSGGAATQPFTAAQPAGAAVAPGVTVSGIGRVTGRPDVLRVTVGVSVTRPSVQAALDEANTAADGLLRALRGQGVAEADIQTRDFSVTPELRFPEGGAPVVSGYTVRNTVEARLRDLTRAGAALSAAVAAGGDAARVEGVGFTLEDNAALLEQAREAAFTDARARAEQYARLTGRSLGALLSVSETVADSPPPAPFAQEAATADAAVPIAPGQQEVAVTVTAVWALR
ncbi:MAG: SIMPL domain-containing protein [Egibacteraceae bacterium]